MSLNIPHPPVNTETPMSDNGKIEAIPTEEYSETLPTPPRIPVSPIVTALTVANNDRSVDIGKVLRNPDPRLNVEFLNDLKLKPVPTVPPESWSYAERRKAQQVLPFIYVGPIMAAKDKDYLRNEGITMILGVQPTANYGRVVTAGAFKAADELGIEHAYITADGARDLTGSLSLSTKLINAHLAAMHQEVLAHTPNAREGKVLVFCESGNDKAATVVAAYLIATFDQMTLIKAIQIMMHARFCVNFTEDLKQVMLTYAEIVDATRAVQMRRQSPDRGGSGKGRKRRHVREVEEHEMDVDQEGTDDEERFRGRSVTPFA